MGHSKLHEDFDDVLVMEFESHDQIIMPAGRLCNGEEKYIVVRTQEGRSHVNRGVLGQDLNPETSRECGLFSLELPFQQRRVWA